VEINTIIRPNRVIVQLWIAALIALAGAVAASADGNWGAMAIILVPLTLGIVSSALALGDHAELGPDQSIRFRTRRYYFLRTTKEFQPLRDGFKSIVYVPTGLKAVWSGKQKVYLWLYYGRANQIINWAEGKTQAATAG
jgi:hypothetical protein